MNTRTKRIVTAVLLAAFILGTGALQARPDGEGKKHHFKRMTKELNLTKDQQAKLKEMMKERRAKHGDMRKQMHAKHKALRDLLVAENVDLNAVKSQLDSIAADRAAMKLEHIKGKRAFFEMLTPAQKSKLQAMHKKHMEGRKKHHEKRKAMHDKREAHHKKMIAKLGLSADQQNQIKSIRDRFKGEIAPLREQKKASHEELHGILTAATFDEAGAKRVAEQFANLGAQKRFLMIKKRLEIEKVLTPEQRAKWKRMHKDMHGKHGKHGKHGRRGHHGPRGDGDED